MSRDQVSQRCRRLRALPVPQVAEHAPAIVDLALTVIAVSAAIVAMVRCECRDCQDR